MDEPYYLFNTQCGNFRKLLSELHYLEKFCEIHLFSVNTKNAIIVVFTKYFQNENKFLIFPHIAIPTLICTKYVESRFTQFSHFYFYHVKDKNKRNFPNISRNLSTPYYQLCVEFFLYYLGTTSE